MDNTYIVETSSSEEETDSDGNDGWLKHDKQDVIYDPKTMFLDMKPKQLPNHARTTDLTKTYRMVIDSNDLIALDQHGNEIQKDFPGDVSESERTSYTPMYVFGFRLDFNKLSHKGFKNVTELHIENFYVTPVTSGDSIHGEHAEKSNGATKVPLNLDSYFSHGKYVKLSQSISHPYSKINGHKTLGSGLTSTSNQPNTIYPGYLPRASNIDIVIDELPSVNQYQHSSRSVFERRNYKYHEDGSYKDNVSVIINSTNLHEISLNRLTFKFFLSGSNRIYKENTATPPTDPPTYSELSGVGNSVSDSFPLLPSTDVLAVFHTDTVEYKQITMTIKIKVKEN
jgi:hypothetical protein